MSKSEKATPEPALKPKATPAPVLPPEEMARIVAVSKNGLKRKSVSLMGPKSERVQEFAKLVEAGTPVYPGFPVLFLFDGNDKQVDTKDLSPA